MSDSGHKAIQRHLAKIPKDVTCLGLPNCRQVTLDGLNLPNLTKLDLYWNMLKRVEAHGFQGSSKARRNQTEPIEKEGNNLLDRLRSLIRLVLSDNFFRSTCLLTWSTNSRISTFPATFLVILVISSYFKITATDMIVRLKHYSVIVYIL